MLRSVAVAVLLAVPTFATAQSDSSTQRAYHACWRGKPQPQCDSFWLTEVSGEYSYVTTQTHYRFDEGSYINEYTRPDISSQVLWTVGPMFNTGPTRAFGGTLSAGFVDDGSRIALEARRRSWTSPGSAVDVSAGVLRSNVPVLPNQFEHGQYGLTAGFFIVGGDVIHINAHADVLFTGDRVRAGGTVGGGLGSYAAAGVSVLAGLLVVAVIIEIARNPGDF
jgi:hypothetical protein